ncbi:MAG: M16 family metallopeptidase [Vicinamibacterales bacterium]
MSRRAFHVVQSSLVVSIAVLVGAVALSAGQAPRPADALRWPTERPPRPLAAKPVKFPPYEIRTLANGLQVVLVSQDEQPIVSARMLIRAGAAQDPKGKEGLAMLAAALLDQGTAARSAAQIAEEIDFMGGILGTGAGSDLTNVYTVSMKDGLGQALDLMADVVLHPAFADSEIERQRSQAMSSLAVAADDPDTVASQVIERLVFGFHPYGMPSGGTAESLAALTRADFVAFHKTWFLPNNALIAIVGDVTPDEGFRQVERVFGAWAKGTVPAIAPVEPPPPVKRLIVIDKPGAVQTEIRAGHVLFARKHPDHLVMDQVVKILGGEGGNRLQQVLRSQKALTYGASADLDAYKQTGAVIAETDTRTEATVEAVRTVVDEFYRLQRERVYEGELRGAQDFLAGSFPLSIEEPDAIASRVLNQLFYELPLDDLPAYPERVRSVTVDDVQRVAKAWLKPSQLSVVLVGDADRFIKDLEGAGFSNIERIPINQLDLTAADLRKARPGARP